MYLWAQSDASYLCESRARSRTAGIMYLSNKPQFPILPDSPTPKPNGRVLVISKIIDVIISSSQEDDNGAGFITAKEMISCCITLEEMGYKQGPTSLQFNNKCATGIIHDQIRQKSSKSMNM